MAQYKGAASEGGRALALTKKREREMEELEERRKKIKDKLKVSHIKNKFEAVNDEIETQLKTNTIGLVTLDEMKAKQQRLEDEREQEVARTLEQKRLKEIQERREQKELEKKQINALSFNLDDEEEEDEEEEKIVEIPKVVVKKEKDEDSVPEEEKATKIGKIGKNPDVDTSFLPDKNREEDERQLREELRKEWVERQRKLKEEDIDITFSYWDGSGHRRTVSMKKGNSIYQFLQKILEQLRGEFHDLRVITADQLMYVKEDLIIPQHYTFYDFIVTKARGKSGPLFNFDVHEDIRMLADVSKEKDESHAGKVLLRSWYERNKHIFPASRWEPYDPTKSYDKYTIKDTK